LKLPLGLHFSSFPEAASICKCHAAWMTAASRRQAAPHVGQLNNMSVSPFDHKKIFFRKVVGMAGLPSP
jgi:hypothetical protein